MTGLLRGWGGAWLLLPWAGWITGMVFTGAALDYVAGWHVYLQILALAILGFTLIGEFINRDLGLLGHVHGPDCDHGPDCHHGQDPSQVQLSATLVLAHLVPMILFLAVGPATLGFQQPAAGLQTRNSPTRNSLTQALPEKQRRPLPAPSGSGYMVTDLGYLFARFIQGDVMPARVRVVGQIYTFPPEQQKKIPAEVRNLGVKSYLFRYQMSCCAADARPISLALTGPDLPRGSKEEWFEVLGRPRIIDGPTKYLALEADKVKTVPKPASPYIIMSF